MLAFELLASILAFIFGVFLLTYSSEKAVEHSVVIASAWGISPIMIGLLLVSIGTDLPEISNSIVSSALGHGNINVGDSIGSALTQITLVLGIIALLVREFKIDKKEIAVIGGCEILALIIAVSVVEKGYISRVNGFLLVFSWFIFMLISRTVTKKDKLKVDKPLSRKPRHFLMAFLGFIGVAVGSYIVVESLLELSKIFNVSEYLMSFFVASIGTSLPELVVDLTAIRKREYELAIGDIIGSSLVDASLSIGIGPMLFTNVISGGIAFLSGLYAILTSILVVSALALRGKVDKKAGVFFIVIYLFSYILLY